ncbi:MAG: hypothetical protein FWH28_04900 [Clostridiales bacterium]|nr:hypothetical protein [Clostridiales bacterium]
MKIGSAGRRPVKIQEEKEMTELFAQHGILINGIIAFLGVVLSFVYANYYGKKIREMEKKERMKAAEKKNKEQ